jgi:heat shock protein HtpX
MVNNLKTAALLALLSVVVWGIAVALFPDGGFVIGLVIAGVMNFTAWFASDKIALAASRARPATEAEYPIVHDIVRTLTARLDMPMPSIHIIDNAQPNAFATGRSPRHAAVAVTTGILDVLDREELEGVLGHELAHVANRDILIGSVAAMLAATITMLTRMAFWFGGGRRDANNPVGAIIGLLSFFLAPIAAMLIQTAISRSREFEADASGAGFTGKPLALASALRKIEVHAERMPMNVNPATASLYIENPRRALDRRGGMGRMFSTHPPIAERIDRLEQLAGPVRR